MKKVLYGLRNVWYSVITENADGTITYATPKSFLAQGAGAKNVSLAPAGDSNQYYADDIVWDETENNNGYEGDFTLTDLSDDFKKDVLGYIEDSNGALGEIAGAVTHKFALGFEVQNNPKPQRTWYYYCSCGRVTDEHASNESGKSYAEPKLNLQARPRPTDKHVKWTLTDSEDHHTAYENYFSSVYEPVLSA